MSLLPILDCLRQLPESSELLESAPAIGAYFDRHALRSSRVEAHAPPRSGNPS